MRPASSQLRRLFLLAAASAGVLSSCAPPSPEAGPALTAAESKSIGDSIRTLVTAAYNLTASDVPAGMLSIYPPEGRVVSATAGRVTTTRDLVGIAVRSFWDGVGQFMIRPTWTWDAIEVDVISRDAAVMTAQYTVPHWTDRGAPHVIGGVWTAVWQRRGGRWEVTNEHLSDMPRASAEALEATMPSIAPTARPDSGSAPGR